jgi:hypothetical protein
MLRIYNFFTYNTQTRCPTHLRLVAATFSKHGFQNPATIGSFSIFFPRAAAAADLFDNDGGGTSESDGAVSPP